MVNLNPPKAPEMTEVDGQLYRPEDVDAAKARLDVRNKMRTTGYADPTPIGVATPTDNRRRTVREQFLADNDPTVDPAGTALQRSATEDVGPVTTDPLDAAGAATPEPAADSGKGKRSKAEGAE